MTHSRQAAIAASAVGRVGQFDRDQRAEAAHRPGGRAHDRDRRAGRDSGPAGPPDGRPAARPALRRWPGPGPAAAAAYEPAQRQIGLHRPPGPRRAACGCASQRVERSRSSAPGHQRPEQGVGVAGDQLGRRVQHDVGAGGQRLLQHRRGERVVHHEQRGPGRPARPRWRGGRRPRSSGWSATPARPGRRPSAAREDLVGVGHVDPPDGPAQPGGPLVDRARRPRDSSCRAARRWRRGAAARARRTRRPCRRRRSGPGRLRARRSRPPAPPRSGCRSGRSPAGPGPVGRCRHRSRRGPPAG